MKKNPIVNNAMREQGHLYRDPPVAGHYYTVCSMHYAASSMHSTKKLHLQAWFTVKAKTFSFLSWMC